MAEQKEKLSACIVGERIYAPQMTIQPLEDCTSYFNRLMGFVTLTIKEHKLEPSDPLYVAPLGQWMILGADFPDSIRFYARVDVLYDLPIDPNTGINLTLGRYVGTVREIEINVDDERGRYELSKEAKEKIQQERRFVARFAFESRIQTILMDLDKIDERILGRPVEDCPTEYCVGGGFRAIDKNHRRDCIGQR